MQIKDNRKRKKRKIKFGHSGEQNLKNLPLKFDTTE